MRIAVQQLERRMPVTARESLTTSINSTRSVTAPVGGWNARDALADMKENEAIRLTNIFPRPTYCEVRGGAVNWATGMAAGGKSLMAWNGPTGSNKLFAGTSSGIYNVTNSGAVGAAETATCTSGKFQSVNFATASGTEFLIAVNGTDKMLYYDGTTWESVDGVSAHAVTGVTTSNIIHVNVFKFRLFFIEKSKLSFWYLPVSSLGGAAVEFQLNSIFSRGGYVMAMGTWTIDSGTGSDDLAVFVTSEGEAAVIRGSNPASSTDWTLVGVYFVGRPIGRRCFAKFGGDMVLLTENGAYPLSAALLTAAIDRVRALTNKIEQAFTTAARLYQTVFGWDVTPYLGQSALIVNIPNAEGGTHQQYVMNTITKCWCQFSGWDAECFTVFNGELYFCRSGSFGTAKAWSGAADFGANIVVDVKQAFNYFGSDDQKLLQMVRPILNLTGPVSFLIGADADFNDSQPSGVAVYTVGAAALWDTAIWDVDVWSTDFILQKDWKTATVMPGFCFALLLRVATNQIGIQWPSTDFVFQRGTGAVT
jgi:hypothetical protein